MAQDDRFAALELRIAKLESKLFRLRKVLSETVAPTGTGCEDDDDPPPPPDDKSGG
jgi:hypothetical protein